MSDLFAAGRVVDLILGFLVAEGLVLYLYYRRTGRGLTFTTLIPALLAGAFLLLALRGALTGAGWQWIALALIGALIAHLVDLGRGWRR